MSSTTKIRWASASWNVGIGCEHVSPGCHACYADALATKYAGKVGWPASFGEGIWKPEKLRLPAAWARNTKTQGPKRIFVNSLSDVHWERWSTEQIDSLYDVMLEVPDHDYLVLTKRPQRMARYFLGAAATKVDGRSLERSDTGEIHPDGYLARRGLTELPPQVWLGTTIEMDRYSFRADWLRAVPANVRFLSCEPLIGHVHSLDLTGLHWVIEGGESGNGSRNFRELDWDWARDLRDRCAEAGVAFFHKQGSGVRTEMYQEIDGVRIEQYPLPHPETILFGQRAPVGIYTDAAPEVGVIIG